LGLFQKGELDSERELGFRVVVNPKRRTAAAAAAAADQQRAVL
jgi:CHASE1-domain containing sensor protein